jgi:PPOX class probable F420-dependent enzyme
MWSISWACPPGCQQLLKGAIILLGAAADVGRRQVARESAPAPDRVTRVIEMAMTEARGRGMTPEERDEFLLSGAKFAKIATTTEDGWPTASPVWYEWDGSSFLVVGKERTGYVRNLRRDPRCGVLVENPGLPYARVSVLAVAEFLPDDFDWRTPAHRMVLRYIGEAGLDYAKATFKFPRVSLRLWPRRMSTWNGAGFDRTFHRDAVWHEVQTPPQVTA